MLNCNIQILPDSASIPETSLSVATKLRFVKATDGYNIVFHESEWNQANTDILFDTALNTLTANKAGETFVFDVFVSKDISSDVTLSNVYALMVYILKTHQAKPVVTVPETFVEKLSKLQAYLKSDEDDEETDDWFNDLGSEDSDEDDDKFDIFGDLLDDDEPAKKRKKKSYYGTSRVWKESDHIKRSINRHGVVIASKDDIKRDEKIIKEFLKEFIPGKEGWKKSFRQELLKRWMNVYVISKKRLKGYESEMKNKKSRKSNNKNLNTAIGLASKLLKPRDTSWFDPSK